MIIQRQRYRHKTWEGVTRGTAREIIAKQLARVPEEVGYLLDRLAKGAILDCGTRGILRRKPAKRPAKRPAKKRARKERK